MITVEQVLSVWDYDSAMKTHKRMKSTEMFKAFREYTGNYRLDEGSNKGLGLLGALEYCRHRTVWRKGRNLYRPFGYFNSMKESAEGVYARLVAEVIDRPQNNKGESEDSILEMFLRGFCEEAPKRGLDFRSWSTREKVELFFVWLAGCCKGIEIEGEIVAKLNRTSAAIDLGWVFERAEGWLEAHDVDIVGTSKDGRKSYFSVKTGGAFSLGCVEAYRKKPGCDLPHYYVNEKLELRKPGSLHEIGRIDIT